MCSSNIIASISNYVHLDLDFNFNKMLFFRLPVAADDSRSFRALAATLLSSDLKQKI